MSGFGYNVVGFGSYADTDPSVLAKLSIPDPTLQGGCTTAALGWACNNGGSGLPDFASHSASDPYGVTIPTGSDIVTDVTGLKADTLYRVSFSATGGVLVETQITMGGFTAYAVEIGRLSGLYRDCWIVTPAVLSNTQLRIIGALGNLQVGRDIVVVEYSDRLDIIDAQLTMPVLPTLATLGPTWTAVRLGTGVATGYPTVGGGVLEFYTSGDAGVNAGGVACNDIVGQIIGGGHVQYRLSWTSTVMTDILAKWEFNALGFSDDNVREINTYTFYPSVFGGNNEIKFAREGTSAETSKVTVTGPFLLERLPQ